MRELRSVNIAHRFHLLIDRISSFVAHVDLRQHLFISFEHFPGVSEDRFGSRCIGLAVVASDS